MTCQGCGKKPATTFLKKTINGKTTELHLCADCAAKQGLGGVLGGFDLGDFWGSLFAEPSLRQQADTVHCKGCGRTFSEIAQSGRAGCPECYTTFYDRLLPSIQRIHGKTRHTGKIPAEGSENGRRDREIEQLRKQLSDCIMRQEYEQCAALRDRIHELESQCTKEADSDDDK